MYVDPSGEIPSLADITGALEDIVTGGAKPSFARDRGERAAYRQIDRVGRVVGPAGHRTIRGAYDLAGGTALDALAACFGKKVSLREGEARRGRCRDLPIETALALPIGKPGKALPIIRRIFGGRAFAPRLKTTPKQVQKKFKHAGDFGVSGNWNKSNAAAFEKALHRHVTGRGVKTVRGTYNGQPVIHAVDPSTRLNVIRSRDGAFVSGWKLSDKQLTNVLRSGKL